MSSYIVTPTQKKALAVATAIAIVGGYFFLRPYFSLIAFASILAFMFNGLYHRLNHRWNNPNRSSAVVLVVALLVLIIPLIGVVAISIRQIDSLLQSLDSSTVNNLIASAITTMNNIISSLGFHFSINQGDIINNLQEPLKEFGENTLKSLPSLFSSFFSLISTSIIFIFVFVSILKNQKALVKTAHSLNPLGQEISSLYLARIAAMTKAMVRGQFIIAFLQGLTDAALLAIAGLPNLFFFFLVVLTALSVIPLGGGIVAIPIGIFMILTGNIVGGLIVILGHIVIVTNIDNVLRPRLVPKEAKLDSALTLLSVFAGLKLFGFLGIVIGPVIMILIVTTVQVYQEVHGYHINPASAYRSRGVIARTARRIKRIVKG